MEKLINRLRYPMTITSLLSAIFLILKNLGVIDIEDEAINVIINGVVSILMTLGIVMSPTNNKEIISKSEEVSNNINEEEISKVKK